MAITFADLLRHWTLARAAKLGWAPASGRHTAEWAACRSPLFEVIHWTITARIRARRGGVQLG
jgi:hypothetical protein